MSGDNELARLLKILDRVVNPHDAEAQHALSVAIRLIEQKWEHAARHEARIQQLTAEKAEDRRDLLARLTESRQLIEQQDAEITRLRRQLSATAIPMPADVAQMIRFAQQHRGLLNDKERDFIETIARYDRPITKDQSAWLKRITRQLERKLRF